MYKSINTEVDMTPRGYQEIFLDLVPLGLFENVREVPKSIANYIIRMEGLLD